LKAIVISNYGGRDQLQLEDIPAPSVEKDEVLVKIHATSVNPLDWKVREGMLKGRRDFQFPLILGWDFSGVVIDVGEEVSQHYQIGDAVFGMPDLTKNGTYAEYISVKADYIAPKPRNLSHVEAASIPLVGLTAWQSLVTHGNLQQGEKVLIHAGAGGVGSFAIQLAKHLGAYVATTVSERNKDFVSELGADEVIDYQKQDFAAQLADFDVVFDTVGGATLEKSCSVLKPGGRLITIAGSPNASLEERYAIRIDPVEVEPNGQHMKEILTLLENRKIRPVVEQQYRLDEIQKAHEVSESRHLRGKIGIVVQ